MSEKIETCPLKVSVRIRPIDSSETLIVNCDNNKKFLAIGDRGFVFDQIFDSTSKQDQVYDATIRPLISKLLMGYSCTVLTYGQTGTGKTYTVFGNLKSCVNDDDSGLISRTLDQIFLELPQNDAHTERRVEISFIEIYNQKIIDMFKQNQLDKTVICSIKNLKVEPNIFQEVKTCSEAQELLAQGIKKRHVGHTRLNEFSSRSHAIFTIQITTQTENVLTISKLNLVDLGGSERINKTGNEGLARQEGININQSLLCLRQVLTAISKNEKIVPFRDSVLTTILHDSLTVKNFIILIACICPKLENLNETITTLRFAESAKNIISKPDIDVIYNNLSLQKLQNIGKFGCLHSAKKTPKENKLNYTIGTPYYNSLKMNLSKIRKSFTSSAFRRRKTKQIFKKFKKDILTGIPECFDSSTQSNYDLKMNDSNFSTSTKLDNMDAVYSPIVRKCTQQIETRLEDLVKTQLYTVISRRSTRRILPINSPKFENSELSDTILSTIDKKIEKFFNIKSQEFSMKSFSTSDASLCDCTCTRKLFIESGHKNIESEEIDQKLRKLLELADDKENLHPTKTRIIKRPQHYSPVLRQILDKRKNKHKSSSKFNYELSQIKNYKALTPKSKQNAFIFTLLNTGNVDDLSSLPTIGKKTATQIITYRMINGEFSSIKDMKSLPFWKGKQFERFLIANNIS